ncbi:hypothetical protein AMTR_s00032p00033310 [Amborella trichopoda]|uniref:Uncharacterized protein n=1 Tax=Amborella trichopoda TaxID=13333 RepID=U5D052_AMBTC|nr:hypothetical protein AMTR_s00032p00033310 [Amborella trichopoda]
MPQPLAVLPEELEEWGLDRTVECEQILEDMGVGFNILVRVILKAIKANIKKEKACPSKQ